MLNVKILKNKPWWDYLEHDLQELITESLLLIIDAQNWKTQFHDYSFIVFPAAKAYEGFLKKLFLDMGFISEQDYYGTRYRIGKSLNPNLEIAHRGSDWVYADLEKFCQGRDLPDQLWNTWKLCRNQIFHWFPHEQKVISLKEAQDRVEMVVTSIDGVFSRCQVKLK